MIDSIIAQSQRHSKVEWRRVPGKGRGVFARMAMREGEMVEMMPLIAFPAADLKIFLTASPEERAQRRYKQLKDKESGVSLAALSREITERDLRDSTRAVAPLRPAADARTIDSTGLSIEAVVARVLEWGAGRLWA